VKYVALMSFVDPTDGGQIEKGRTYVSHEADVFRQFPERFEIARSSSFDGAITRPGGTARLVGKRQRAPKRLAKKTPALSRPSWQLTRREPWRLR
jgi:hypothetical protein